MPAIHRRPGPGIGASRSSGGSLVFEEGMDRIQSIWLSPAAGAGRFFGPGLLGSRGVRRKDGATADASSSLAQVQAEKEARQRAEVEPATLTQRNAELTRSVSEERARAESAQKAQGEAQRLREQVNLLQADVNKA